ncbi:MAG: hypothetical protein KME64_17505 [Scytonematopsis contorta HA4267-MV1]|jgi:hypothetical protein|nr:hypothetical protein [Scytonematopsis contorta HA4267-MV1]
MQTQPDWKNLIEKLSNGSDVDVVEAAKALTNYPHQDCVTSLLEFIKSEQSAFSLSSKKPHTIHFVLVSG